MRWSTLAAKDPGKESRADLPGQSSGEEAEQRYFRVLEQIIRRFRQKTFRALVGQAGIKTVVRPRGRVSGPARAPGHA